MIKEDNRHQNTPRVTFWLLHVYCQVALRYMSWF
ncbi:hypothetical protein BVRB_5g098000 [Beta vulgaris subsp. vulgaris]|nr:hypothetical protein BVRB_5g098000 [Beta vulgaris subsp. vulgaris]